MKAVGLCILQTPDRGPGLHAMDIFLRDYARVGEALRHSY